MRNFAEIFKQVIKESIGTDKPFRNYRELAQAAGVSSPVISLYATGRTQKPDPEILAKLSTALGYTNDYLLNIWLDCRGLSSTSEFMGIKEPESPWPQDEDADFQILVRFWPQLDAQTRRSLIQLAKASLGIRADKEKNR